LPRLCKNIQGQGAFFNDLNGLNGLNDWNNSPGERIERTLRLAQGSRINQWAFSTA
jgi:hypothetical protein